MKRNVPTQEDRDAIADHLESAARELFYAAKHARPDIVAAEWRALATDLRARARAIRAGVQRPGEVYTANSYAARMGKQRLPLQN